MKLKEKNKEAKYYLDDSGNFVIEEYNSSKPFANFFPGIAGKYGIPMWVFYVNRGQAISSFGTRDKDHPILEFFPANKSWQFTTILGFRTFLKVRRKAKTIFYEPFQPGFPNLEFNIKNRMLINTCGLILEEDNLTLGIRTRVEYFTVPQDSYAGLVRKVTLEDTGGSQVDLEVLDGLPQVSCFGLNNFFLKKMGRTIEAWMRVENLSNSIPFYKLDVDPADRPQVIHIDDGNFFLSFEAKPKNPKPVMPVVDPQAVFGSSTDFSYPLCFLKAKKFTASSRQNTVSKTPSAFAPFSFLLKPKGSVTYYSVYGNMRNLKMLNDCSKKILDVSYLENKRRENIDIVRQLQEDIAMKSSCVNLDLYAKQTYIDNIMRGGYPVVFNNGEKKNSVYLYSRKHGDLERDYNRFYLQPTYFSQGNGNYRDANQNRRLDVWFNPDIEDDNILSFFSLIQSDGFNPLVVKGDVFSAKNNAALEKKISSLLAEGSREDAFKLASFISKPFTPGELVFFIEKEKIRVKVPYDALLDALMPCCQKQHDAEHGEGFWIDHWAYNMDLLESYLGVYPDRLRQIVFENKSFSFYDNFEVVKPRSQKYTLFEGKVRQLHSVSSCKEKREMIKRRAALSHCARKDYGKGEVYYTSLFNKLLCVIANKTASFDAFGVGIEMEADKPNWFDALNGLPALLGSSSCETFELVRLIRFALSAIEEYGRKDMGVTAEILEFMTKLHSLLEGRPSDFIFWDRATTLKESYREKTRLGFSGKEERVGIDLIRTILDGFLMKAEKAAKKSKDSRRDVYYSYYINEVKEYDISKGEIKPSKFVQLRLPLFLEGQMHALRICENKGQAASMHKALVKSELYDKKLKMYKVTASLKSMPEEIGRCRVFTPGWLENESIWLHMEYKYILELLKKGLYKEFYADFKNVLVPFQDPKDYGRSILENSSFIVSSAFPDPSLHGNGFVARLSGSTAEFLSIWLVMNIGLKPFFLDEKNGTLSLKFSPSLPSWLFDSRKEYAFTLMSKVKVVYHNPGLKDTFGKGCATAKKITFKDELSRPIEILSDTIPAPYSLQIRNRTIKRIDVYLN